MVVPRVGVLRCQFTPVGQPLIVPESVSPTRNPVRLYSIATAGVALGAYFLPSGAWPLVLGLVAAVIGAGAGVRSQVVPTVTVEEHLDTAQRLFHLGGQLPPDDDIKTTGSPPGGDD